MAKTKSAMKVLSLDKIRKKYHTNTAAITIEDDPLWLPSESLGFNAYLGGGIPYGKIMELFGLESVGKSLAAMSFAKTCISLGGVVLWDDAESSWNNHWARQNGIDPDKVELFVESGVELISDWAMNMCYYWRSKLTKNEPILLVIDSLAALDAIVNRDATMADSKAEMGNRAKKIYEFWRVRAPMFYRLGICVIPINQIRDKVGATMFEDGTSTVGGKSTQFYASQRVKLVRGKQIKQTIKGKEKKVGQGIYFQVVKNKVSAPASESLATQVFFRPNRKGELGYSKYAGILPFFLDEGCITRDKGPSLYFNGTKIARSEDNFYEVFEKDGELRKKILKASSINTPSKTRRRLEKMEKNLYPINMDLEDSDEG